MSSVNDYELDRLRVQLADVEAQIAQLGFELIRLRELREQILHQIDEYER